MSMIVKAEMGTQNVFCKISSAKIHGDCKNKIIVTKAYWVSSYNQKTRCRTIAGAGLIGNSEAIKLSKQTLPFLESRRCIDSDITLV